MDISITEIVTAVSLLVTLITGIGVLNAQIKKYIGKALQDQLNEINTNVKRLGDRIGEVDMESTKNFLVNFLAKLEHGEPVDEIERQRFWEQQKHYEKAGGNSYIHRKVELLKEEGKL